MVRMFDFRTKFVTALVWVLAAIQLLMLPAAGLLHSGCDGHSHGAANVNAAETSTLPSSQSLWQCFGKTWHWLTHSGCCQHSHSDRSVVEANASSATTPSHQCSSSCGYCSRRKAEAAGSQQGAEPENQSKDSSVPSHDAHQCVICHVVFAARVNTVVAQAPTQADFVPLAVPAAVLAVEIAPRFQLPTRGPPVA